ncbi:MAG: hypothetical protein GX952_04140 [Firmicutes bacterium]|nr:hypothetical protein [Bacillota bacterium]
MLKRALVIFFLLLVLISGSVAAAIAPEVEIKTEIEAEAKSTLLRGQFAALLVDAAELAGEGEATDILIQHGIMKGVPGKGADADRPIQRAEAAVLLARTLGLMDNIAPPAEADIALPTDHWAYNSYAWLARLGLVSGDPLAVLSPEDGADLLEYAFQPAAEDVLAILEEYQARSQSEPASRVQSVMDVKMKFTARPGAEEAGESLGTLAPEINIVQTLVLPDKIHQINTIKMPVPGEEGTEEIRSESYIVDGHMYQQLPDPETGELTWFKYPQSLMPDLEQLIEQAQQQTQVIPPGLEKTLFYKLLGTSERNGEEVYEISFYSRIEDLEEFLSHALAVMGESEFIGQALGSFGSLVDNLSVWGLNYIGVDDFLPRQTYMALLLTFPELIEDEPIPLESIEAQIAVDEYNFGEDIDISIPSEVLAAPELELPELDFEAELKLQPELDPKP